MNNARAHYNSADSYLVSGIPYVTASSVAISTTTKIEFPFVTKFFVVKNTSATILKIGFTEAGVAGSNYFTVVSGTSQVLDLRIKDLYLRGDNGTCTFEVIAGMTTIPGYTAPVLTGSTSIGNNNFVYSYGGLG